MVLSEVVPAGPPGCKGTAMVRLTDPDVLAKIQHALSQWQFTGYITWKPIARQWVEQNLEGWTTRSVGEEMFRHFQAGGDIDQTRETRPDGANSGITTTSASKLAAGCFTSKRSSWKTRTTPQFTW